MKTRRLIAVAAGCIFGGLAAMPVAFAQGGNAPRAPVAHPATDPSCALAPTPGVAFSTVVGTSWVFHWESTGGELVKEIVRQAGVYHPASALQDPLSGAAVGNMSFLQVADPNSQSGEAGFLNVIETRNLEGEIFRFLNYNGRFEVYADCTGGTLMFNTGDGPIEFDFYFRKFNGDPFGSLRMVGIDGNEPVAAGEAEKQGPS